MTGKALVVSMSRRICVDMYNAIVKLRPDWHSDDDTKGIVKIVMSGSASDELDWQPHIRTKKAREAMAKRYKDPKDELNLVIVRDIGAAVEKLDAGQEMFDGPVLANPLSVARHVPAVQLLSCSSAC